MLSLSLALLAAPASLAAQIGAYDIGSAANGIPIVIPYGTPAVASTQVSAATMSALISSSILKPSAASGTPNAYTILNSALQTYTTLSFPTTFPILPPPVTANSLSTLPSSLTPSASASRSEMGQAHSTPRSSRTSAVVPPVVLSTGSISTASMVPSKSATTAPTISSMPSAAATETFTGPVSSSGAVSSTSATNPSMSESRTGFGSILSTASASTSRIASETSSESVRSILTTITTTTMNNNGPLSTTSVTTTPSGNGINPGVQPATTTAAPPAANSGACFTSLPVAAGGLFAVLVAISAL